MNSILKKFKHGGIQSLVKRALECGISVEFIPAEKSILMMVYRTRRIFFKDGTVPMERRMGNFTMNKNTTKIILQKIGIRTPKGIVAESLYQALKQAKLKKLAYPLIAKPLDYSAARGVTWDIRSEKELRSAVMFLRKSCKQLYKFLVEEMFVGDEFRVLIFKGKVISCVKKLPAGVVGDGVSSIRKLISNFNKTRPKGFRIRVDETVKKTLSKNKHTLKTILPDKFVLKLRHNLNMSDGGRCINCTRAMHPYFKKVCEKAADAAGLTYGGADLMVRDIKKKNSPYVILEINPNPYYNMHEKPLVEGYGADISLKILKHLFPGLRAKDQILPRKK